MTTNTTARIRQTLTATANNETVSHFLTALYVLCIAIAQRAQKMRRDTLQFFGRTTLAESRGRVPGFERIGMVPASEMRALVTERAILPDVTTSDSELAMGDEGGMIYSPILTVATAPATVATVQPEPLPVATVQPEPLPVKLTRKPRAAKVKQEVAPVKVPAKRKASKTATVAAQETSPAKLVFAPEPTKEDRAANAATTARHAESARLLALCKLYEVKGASARWSDATLTAKLLAIGVNPVSN